MQILAVDISPPVSSNSYADCRFCRRIHMQKMLLALLLTSTPVLAQAAFNGTWRLNLSNAQVGVTRNYLLQDGLFGCAACDPPIKGFKADGQPHQANGAPYYDSLTVRVIDDRTVETTSTKNGKRVDYSKYTVAEDNGSVVRDETFTAETGQQNHEVDLWRRTADGPTGAHKISGTWQPEKILSASDSLRDFSYTVTGDAISMRDHQGGAYDAKFDGKDYPCKGDPGTTSVSLKKIDDNTIEETDKREGEVLYISRMTVEADGKTMRIAIQDKLHDSTLTFTATKQ